MMMLFSSNNVNIYLSNKLSSYRCSAIVFNQVQMILLFYEQQYTPHTKTHIHSFSVRLAFLVYLFIVPPFFVKGTRRCQLILSCCSLKWHEWPFSCHTVPKYKSVVGMLMISPIYCRCMIGSPFKQE